MALKQAGVADKITGIEPSEDALRIAKRRGGIDETATDLAQGVQDVQIIVICTPVSLISEIAITASKHCPADCIITDAGSTKASILDAIAAAQDKGEFPAELPFVGAHPIAGGEQSGPDAADADLFIDRRVILTPAEPKNTQAVQTVREMWEAAGAAVSTMQPDAHDQLLAAASHLPHLVAAALSASLGARERNCSAGGLADTTRVAAGDPELWRDILLSNAEPVTAAIDRFQSVLMELREAIAGDDQRKLISILRKAKQNRDAL